MMKLAAIGSNCIDFYENMGKAFPGGGPVNMAVYTMRLGGTASYTGPVGDDANGSVMREALEAKGVNVSHLHTLPGKTAVTQVNLVEGERIFGDYAEGVLENYTLSEQDMNFICTHDVVVCDLWGKVEASLEALHKRGIRTAFDCATRPDDAACAVAIPHSDYVFFSDDGAGDTAELRAKMAEIHARGPKLVVATLGEHGSLCYDGTVFHSFGVTPCEVVDSMGAGDSYIAGFLTGAVKGLPLVQCMEKGALCASVTLGYFGAW